MFAKTILLGLAKQNQEANATVVKILDGEFSLSARQADRGSYYGSLEGLAKHLAGGTLHFLKIAEGSLTGDKTAEAILLALNNVPAIDEKPLDVNGWENLKKALSIADETWVKLALALSDAQYDAPVKLQWYGGVTIALGAFLTMLSAHNIHHRGQLSQIFDSLAITNDYSGIKPRFFD
ncbi:MAG: hypothetical protein LBF86_09275 [Helicobacteraceae bacterium]|jgi:uncharacterized damage-inducible protein DinB|nr:hypothetical protein [Helicobacteraceae bacterium]